MYKDLVSPCISICKIDPVTGYCYGCARTNDEKKFGKISKLLMNGKKRILRILKVECLDGSLIHLTSLIQIKLRKVSPYIRNITNKLFFKIHI